MSQLPIVSVNADWSGPHGHFGEWDRRVADACHTAGRRFISLCNVELADPPPFALPSFSSAYSDIRSTAELVRFEAELCRGLAASAGEQPAIVAMYCGGLHTLQALNVAATVFPNSRFVTNLLRSHQTLGRPATASPHAVASMARSVLAASRRAGVRVAVDSLALADSARQNYRFALEVWPMLMTTPTTVFNTERSAPRPLSVVAPIQPQRAKGYDLLGDLCERLEPDISAGRVSFSTRWSTTPSDDSLQGVAHQIRSAGGQLIEEDLTTEEYGALVASADIVLIPYRLSTFRTRTSAVVLDAIAARAVPIATSGTWAGRLLDGEGIGLTFADGDVQALHEAVASCMERLDEYRSQIEVAAEPIALRYSAGSVLDFLDGAAFAAPSEESVRRTVRDLCFETYQVLDVMFDDREGWAAGATGR